LETLKAHGFEFDGVYMSWLSRALETALYVLDEMDSLWVPTVKSWKLNERMYRELTCLSEQMVKQRHVKNNSWLGGGDTM
jgi:2,3-bisphosphoglycerate-dependent phosphoglycerate mutase